MRRLPGVRSGLRRLLLAAVVAGAVAGCGVAATVSKGPYWLVKVQGNYANVYRYPNGNKPGTSAAVELGATRSEELKHLRAAAEHLGVPMSHVTDNT